jgi:hypothetical protein
VARGSALLFAFRHLPLGCRRLRCKRRLRSGRRTAGSISRLAVVLKDALGQGVGRDGRTVQLIRYLRFVRTLRQRFHLPGMSRDLPGYLLARRHGHVRGQVGQAFVFIQQGVQRRIVGTAGQCQPGFQFREALISKP